jgi:tetratricopeptide (TPR) repeat protein
VEIRKGEPLPFSFVDLQAKVIELGFDHADAVLAETRKSHPELKIDAGDFVRWGWQRLSAAQAREAIPLMKIAVQLDPSGSTYFGLAESYERAGDRKRAIENYRQALDLNSSHIIAKERLEALAP